MKKVREWSLIPLVLVLVVSLLAACAKAPATTSPPKPTTAPPTTSAVAPTTKPASSPTAKPSAAPSTTPAAAPKAPIVLKFNWWGAAGSSFAKSASWLVEQVEARSGGRLKVEYYWSASLIPSGQELDGLKSGIADIAVVYPAYMPAKIPLSTLANLPGLTADLWPADMAWADFMRGTPEIAAEYAKYNVKYLYPVGRASYGFWTTKPAGSIADLKGKKILAVGEHAPVVAKFGVTPVSSIPSNESYTALQRGTVDGAIGGWVYAKTYAWQEVAKYFFALMMGSNSMPVCINVDSWNKLPADIQKMFVDMHDQQAKFNHEDYQGSEDVIRADFTATKGIKATYPSAEDNALLMRVALETVAKDWVDKMEKQGLPGQKMLDRYVELAKKYNELNPYKKK